MSGGGATGVFWGRFWGGRKGAQPGRVRVRASALLCALNCPGGVEEEEGREEAIWVRGWGTVGGREPTKSNSLNGAGGSD